MKNRVTLIRNDNSVIIKSETIYADKSSWNFAALMGMNTDAMHEVSGHFHPWTWRYEDDRGNILIIQSEGTLD